MAHVSDFKSIKLKVASPDEILAWSHGEVLKPETINYRTQRPEKDGLFCEKIFGPEKDWECYCGKYRRIRYKGIVCDKCGVEVTRSIVRRERMGHISLASPVCHIWFLRGIPSKIGLLLDVSVQELEKVVYFASYIIAKIDEKARESVLEEIQREYKAKVAARAKERKAGAKTNIEDINAQKDKMVKEVKDLELLRIISETEYAELSMKYGQIFEVGIGAEAIRKILEGINLEALRKEILGIMVKAS